MSNKEYVIVYNHRDEQGEKKRKKKEKKGILSIWRSRDPSVWYLFMKTFEPKGSVEEAQGQEKLSDDNNSLSQYMHASISKAYPRLG